VADSGTPERTRPAGWSRREMLGGAGAIAGFTFLPSRVLGRAGFLAPSEKLNVAFVGIGRRGSYDLREVANLQHNVVALCDVDWRKLEGQQYPLAVEMLEQFPKARRYDDWRIMLQEEAKNIDAVLVASADHTHAAISIAAMKMGKHVYTEKPLAHSVEEVRAMQAAEKKYKVTTQTGCQGHSSEDCRLIVEWIRDGAIGTVREAHIFLSLNPPARRSSYADVLKTLAEKHEVPEEVKWDLWLGPAPYRDYNPAYLLGRWRSWVDFGEGPLGDYCCHYFDPIFWALDLGLPEKIEARPDRDYDWSTNKQVYPHSAAIRWDFPARGRQPSVAIVWHYGPDSGDIPMPPGWDPKEKLPAAGGGIIFGSQGAIVFGPIYASLPLTASTGEYKPVTWGTPTKIRMFPPELERDYKQPPKTLPRPFNHWWDWLESAKARKPAGAGFSYGGLMTETALLGNIACTQKGKILYYDPKAGRFENNPEANQLLRVSYRKGWELPA